MEKQKKKKIIAPVIIVTIMLIYYIGVGIFFAYMIGVPRPAKILALIIPALLCGVSISVLVQRIKEIKKGEDNDLSKY